MSGVKRVLLLKPSSLGDLIHTLPALTDAANAIPGIRFDWVAEEAFAEIPAWHPAVDRVITIALRRWRKGIVQAFRSGEIARFRQCLQQREYDLIIDAAGLIKSAVVAKMARGEIAGYDARSIRDPRASWFYQYKYDISYQQHAIDRIRKLFALALDYPLPDTPADAGIRSHFQVEKSDPPYLVLLHGTTWPSKHWPEPHWQRLAQIAAEQGYQLRLPWGSETERARAERIAESISAASALPPLSLTEAARQLAAAAGVIGVDTGLSHLACALDLPAVTIYGPTRTDLTGTRGIRQRNLQLDIDCVPCMKQQCRQLTATGEQPCFSALTPERVWQEITLLMQ